MSKLNAAIQQAGVKQIQFTTGKVMAETRVEVKIDVSDLPDASLLMLFRYGYTRKGNDVVNSGWKSRRDAWDKRQETIELAVGKARASAQDAGQELDEKEFRAEHLNEVDIDELVFREEALGDFLALLRTGDFTARRAGLSYEVKATRQVLSAWLRADKMHADSLKKILSHEEQLWATVTRRSWLNLARQSLTKDEIKATDMVAKVDEKLESCKASFAEAIRLKAQQLRTADEAVKPETNLIEGMTL